MERAPRVSSRSWLVIEALEAHTKNRRRVFDRIAVVELCTDAQTAIKRYAALHRQYPTRELGFVHTSRPDLEERLYLGPLSSES